MIYIIYGEEVLFIHNKIKELENNKEAEIIKLDGNSKDFNITTLLDSLDSNSLFSNCNIVEVKDPPFLCKKIDENDIKVILDYCNNPAYENDLIFYTLENKFNSKLKVFKDICNNAQVIKYDFLDYKNFNNYVKSETKRANLNINNDAINLLTNICNRNATLLKLNIDVLKNYPEKIDIQTVKKLCSMSDDNSFDLINAITIKDISKTIEIERRMFKDTDSLIPIINLLASQLRFLYQLSYLQSQGLTKSEIINICKTSEARYIKSQDTLRKLSLNKIIELLSKLSNLDIQCKREYGISDQQRFELFVLNLMR